MRYFLVIITILLAACAAETTPIVVHLPTTTSTLTTTSIPLPTARPTIDPEDWTPTPLPPLRVEFDIVDQSGAPVPAEVWLTLIVWPDSQDQLIDSATSRVSFSLPDDLEADDYYITIYASGYLLWNERIPPEALQQPVLSGTVVLEKLE